MGVGEVPRGRGALLMTSEKEKADTRFAVPLLLVAVESGDAARVETVIPEGSKSPR